MLFGGQTARAIQVRPCVPPLQPTRHPKPAVASRMSKACSPYTHAPPCCSTSPRRCLPLQDLTMGTNKGINRLTLTWNTSTRTYGFVAGGWVGEDMTVGRVMPDSVILPNGEQRSSRAPRGRVCLAVARGHPASAWPCSGLAATPCARSSRCCALGPRRPSCAGKIVILNGAAKGLAGDSAGGGESRANFPVRRSPRHPVPYHLLACSRLLGAHVIPTRIPTAHLELYCLPVTV
jgi:hypothetical protein